MASQQQSASVGDHDVVTLQVYGNEYIALKTLLRQVEANRKRAMCTKRRQAEAEGRVMKESNRPKAVRPVLRVIDVQKGADEPPEEVSRVVIVAPLGTAKPALDEPASDTNSE